MKFHAFLSYSTTLILGIFSFFMAHSSTINIDSTASEKKETKSSVVQSELSSLSFGKKKKAGTLAMARGNYFDAIEYLQAAYSEKPKKWKLLYSLGAANLKARNYINAENWYAKLCQTKKGLKKFPQAKFEQALALKSMGQYTAAADTFRRFMSGSYKEAVEMAKKYARRELQGCLMMDTLAYKLPTFKVTTLGTEINSPFNDQAPFSGDLFSLYFNSKRGADPYNLRETGTGSALNKFFESKKYGGNWEAAAELTGDLNTQKTNISDFYQSPDGKSVYYTRQMPDEKGNFTGKIFVSENTGSGWSVGRMLGSNINVEGFTSCQPMEMFNADGKEVLYFSSNKPDGKGGYDIYFSMKGESGEFGRAKNAGGGINTPGNEVTPFFDAENKILYFSSNGHFNIGALDVFKSQQNTDGTEWGEVTNLGTSVNSSADDYYFRPGKGHDLGFFVSNRKGGQSLKCETCSDDIYAVRLLRGMVKILGTVSEDNLGTKKPLADGRVDLFRSSDNVKIADAFVNDGRFTTDIDKENESVYLLAKKTDFEDAKVTLNIGEYKPESIITELILKYIPKVDASLIGSKIGIVYFEFDKDILKSPAPDTLDKVINFMKANPQYVVEVGGHTDDIGSDSYNDTLGMNRAIRVSKVLTVNGKISEDHLKLKSYGEKSPAAQNKTAEGKDNPTGRALNRRVEFIILEEKK